MSLNLVNKENTLNIEMKTTKNKNQSKNILIY